MLLILCDCAGYLPVQECTGSTEYPASNHPYIPPAVRWNPGQGQRDWKILL